MRRKWSVRQRQADAPRVSERNAAVAPLALDFELVEPGDSVVECNLVVEAQGVIRKPRHVRGSGAGTAAVPDIGTEVMVIVAGRKEARAGVPRRHQLHAEYVAIEGVRLGN